ncbi:hypothetical protein TNCV_4423881 [Trichonephila clavipes]|nr:hypothetical protein TNCV_4423881 [Trichonephila clavipes]
MLPVIGKKAVLEWCMKEGLFGSSYACPECRKRGCHTLATGLDNPEGLPYCKLYRQTVCLTRIHPRKSIELRERTESLSSFESDEDFVHSISSSEDDTSDEENFFECSTVV